MTDPNKIPTLEDIEDSKKAMDDIQSFTYSGSDTFVDAKGITRDTVTGRIKKMGYTVPIPYVSSIFFDSNDNVKTVEESNIVYAPLPSSLPFTTSGTFIGDDDARFFVVQGLTEQAADVRYVRTYKTLADWQNDPFAVAGVEVTPTERTAGKGGGAPGQVIVGTGTVDGFGIVAHNTLSLSWVLEDSHFYSLQMFGTSSAACQAAVDKLALKGGTLFVNALYQASVTVNLKTNVNIVSNNGAGVTPVVGFVGSHIFKDTGGINNVRVGGLKFDFTDKTISGISILDPLSFDIDLDHNKFSNLDSPTPIGAIFCQEASDVRIFKNRFTSFSDLAAGISVSLRFKESEIYRNYFKGIPNINIFLDDAIGIAGVTDLDVHHNVIKDGGTYGIRCGRCTNVDIHHNTILEALTAPTNGITTAIVAFIDSDNVNIHHNRSVNGGEIASYKSNNITIESNYVKGYHIESNDTEVASLVPDGKNENYKVINNRVIEAGFGAFSDLPNSQSGIFVSGSNGIIQGNTVTKSKGHGFNINSGLFETAITGNIAKNNGQGTGTNDAGMKVGVSTNADGYRNIVISGNILVDDQTGSETQDRGLYLDTANITRFASILITGNVSEGNKVVDFFASGGGITEDSLDIRHHDNSWNVTSGPTANRPTAANWEIQSGTKYYDEDIEKPLFWNINSQSWRLADNSVP